MSIPDEDALDNYRKLVNVKEQEYKDEYIQQALQELPLFERTCLLLQIEGEFAEQDIADIVDKSQEEVTTAIHYAREHVRQHYHDIIKQNQQNYEKHAKQSAQQKGLKSEQPKRSVLNYRRSRSGNVVARPQKMAMIATRFAAAIIIVLVVISFIIKNAMMPSVAYAEDFRSAYPRQLSLYVPPSGWVHTVAWSPKVPSGGQIIALLWSDNITQVWSIDEQRELFHVTVGWGQGLAFSPDGRYLATAGKEDSTFQVLDVEKCIAHPTDCEKESQVFRGDSSLINGLSWSPDGKYIVSASANNTVSIWDVNNNMQPPLYTHHNPMLYSKDDGSSHQYTTVAWSPDGTRIAVGDDMGNVQIWKAIGGENPLAIYHSPGGVDPVTSVSWSSDKKSRYIVSAGYRGFAYVWDTKASTGAKPLHATIPQQGDTSTTNNTNNPIYSVAWSPTNPNVIAVANYSAITFYSTDGRFIDKYDLSQDALEPVNSNLFTVAWSPDGKQLAVGGENIVLSTRF